jgi:flagellar basal-body rod modification protein FlgD
MAGVSGTSSATGTTDTGSTSAAAAKSASSMDGTFLKLLTTELQNQDPTAPMDSTQMVSQMISLNQLNQTIAIRELVQGSSIVKTTGSNSGSDSSSQGTSATGGN